MSNKTSIFCIGLFIFWGCNRTERINREIELQNRFLPEMLSDTLRIDSIHFNQKNNTLEYYYTVFNDSFVLLSNYNETQRKIAIKIKKTPDMAIFRNQRITFEYIYISNKSKSILTKITITEQMYR